MKFNSFNKTLVIFLLFLLLLYIINDLDNDFELEGCHCRTPGISGCTCGRRRPPPPRPPALPNDRAIGIRYR